jgi:Pentapeptide repeats (8 copies)
MANEEHLAILNQGVEVWNEWRERNSKIILDLREAYLREADLSGADLSGAYLSGANLRRAILRRADLSRAYLVGTDLRRADLSGAYLVGTDLSRAYLSGVALNEANLNEANLGGADLREADLSRADLGGTNFLTTQALATNFQGSTLTGACLEDWHINSETNLENVICDYVYLKSNQQERRPHDPNKTFAPGEFTKLFQKVRETVDLIFSDGIDWQAFLVSFQELQIECGSDELFIQSFENKGNGAFVIRVNVPPGAEKAEIEKYLKRQYQLEAQLEAQSRELANLYEITKLLASKPINVHNMASSEFKGDTINQSGSFGIGVNQGEVQAEKLAGTINEAQSKSLAETAAEIQQLLEQLSQTYPTSTNKEKMAVVAEAVDQIESNPTLKARVINAFKAGGTEAFKEAINHPLVNILIATIEGWQEAE